MKKLTSALIVVSLCLIGCGAEDPLSRGERAVSDLDGGFGKPVDGDPGQEPTSKPSEKVFNEAILPLVSSNTCTKCHDNFADTYEHALALVVFGKPNESTIYKRAVLGDGHRSIWKVGSAEATLLENWINGLDADGKPIAAAPSELPALKLSEKTFNEVILPMVSSSTCTKCHDNYADTYENALALVVVGKPNESVLYQRPVLGKGHKSIWKADSDQAKNLVNWINGL